MTASAASRGALDALSSPSSGLFSSRIRNTAAAIEKALASLSVFSETYQAAVDQREPLFLRRRTEASA